MLHFIDARAGHESYKLWKVCFSNIIGKIYTLRVVTVMGVEVELDPYLGGDYKFLLTVCGESWCSPLAPEYYYLHY